MPLARVPVKAALLLALCLAAGAACDKSNGTPTAPSGALQISATRTTLQAGETMPLAVTSAGAPATGVSWISSDATVVTVSPAGQATAGRPGRATVTASSASASGSLALRVVPDYNGTWSGSVVRLQIACSAASTSALCAPGAPTGGSMTLRLTQVGDQASGTLVDSAEPAAVVPLTGQVLADDHLALAGRLDAPTTAPTMRVDVATWRASLDVTLGTLAGSYNLAVDRARTGAVLQQDYSAQVQFRDLRRQ